MTMKYLATWSILFIAIIMMGTACKKPTTGHTAGKTPDTPGVPRKIQFSLYTDRDFSSDNKNITFTLFIQNPASQVLWDSVLTPMKIKEIPDLAHKLVIEKTVPGNDGSLLKVGFRYAIENVGISWYFDSSSAGEKFKIVDFNFR